LRPQIRKKNYAELLGKLYAYKTIIIQELNTPHTSFDPTNTTNPETITTTTTTPKKFGEKNCRKTPTKNKDDEENKLRRGTNAYSPTPQNKPQLYKENHSEDPPLKNISNFPDYGDSTHSSCFKVSEKNDLIMMPIKIEDVEVAPVGSITKFRSSPLFCKFGDTSKFSKSDFRVAITGEPNVPGQIVDISPNGNLEIHCHPLVPGAHGLQLYYKDTPLLNCPFTFMVQHVTNDTKKQLQNQRRINEIENLLETLST